MRKLIDTHCHLYDEAFAEELPIVIERACEAGVEYMLMPAVNPQTIPNMLDVCDQWPQMCRPMIGLHPEDLATDWHSQLDSLKSILDHDHSPQGAHRFIGIGETGLDLYWDKSRLDEQIESFRTQIEWALEYDLPVVIHSRDSFEQLYNVISSYRDTALRGVFHCFSGTAEQASALMEFSGFMFGIGGTVTYKKSVVSSSLVTIPIERVLLETDSPYLPPVPHRGKRNEPSYMLHTAAMVAQLYGMALDEVAKLTTQNARRLFRI